MTVLLRLYNNDESIVVDLAGGTWRLLHEEWAPTLFQGDKETQEVIPLVSKPLAATSAAYVDTAINEGSQPLEELLRQGALWKENPSRAQSVWFEWQPDGASVQRAAVVGGYLQPLPGRTHSPHVERGQPIRANLVIKRWGWESPQTRQEGVVASGGGWFMPSGPPTYPGQQLGTISATGGTVDIAAGGTAPGRMKLLKIRKMSGNVITAWMGIKPTNMGVANFTPVWEAEIGAGGAQCTLTDSDSTASNGTYYSVTFTTLNDNGLPYRISNIGPSGTEGAGATPIPPDFWGQYLVLMRYRLPSVAGGEVFGATLKAGVVNKVALDEVLITAEDAASGWNWIEMGEVVIPGFATRNGYAGDVWYSFDLQLQQIAGTLTDFDVDCFLLIPTEHYCRVGSASLTSTLEEIVVETAENDEVFAWQRLIDDEEALYMLFPEPRNWNVPIEGGVLVIATTNNASFAGATDVTNEVAVGMEIVDRWATWRGV